MAIHFETGYALPSGDEPLTHARILHSGNTLRGAITASHEETFAASAADDWTTFEKWQPFANEANEDLTAWSVTGAALGSDGQTLTEDTSTGEHYIQVAHTFGANVEHIFCALIEKGSAVGVRLLVNDGTSNFANWFDLRDNTVQSGTGYIEDMGDGVVKVVMRYLPAAATGFVRIQIADDTFTTSYTGASRSFAIKGVSVHESNANWDIEALGAMECDTLCIGAHNLAGGEVSLYHDSDGDDTWTFVQTIDIADNSEIMFIFEPITSAKWRVSIGEADQPAVGVIKIGKSLQMPRPIYGGHAPLHMSRSRQYRSNTSESGEILGRTVARTAIRGSFEWQHLSASWIRTNWRPFQTAADDAFFIAWRPESFGEVALCESDGPSIPSNMGILDLMAVSLSVKAFSYD